MPGRASGSGSSSRDNRSAVEGPHGAPGGIADRRAPGPLADNKDTGTVSAVISKRMAPRLHMSDANVGGPGRYVVRGCRLCPSVSTRCPHPKSVSRTVSGG